MNQSWFPNSLIASKLNLALCKLPEEAEFVPLWVVCDGKDAQVRFCNILIYVLWVSRFCNSQMHTVSITVREQVHEGGLQSDTSIILKKITNI